MRVTGVVADTPVWCSAGFYKSARDLSKKDSNFVTESFNLEDYKYYYQRGKIVRAGETKLVSVTYVREGLVSSLQESITVICGENTDFLVSDKNSHSPCYNDEVLSFVKAKFLKPAMRIWAEDLCLTIKKVELLNSVGTVYSFVPSDSDCNTFTIDAGALIRI